MLDMRSIEWQLLVAVNLLVGLWGIYDAGTAGTLFPALIAADLVLMTVLFIIAVRQVNTLQDAITEADTDTADADTAA